MNKSITILEFLKKVTAVRRYQRKKIPIDLLLKIIESGRWAQSAHDFQPWKFVLVIKRTLINDIAEIVLDKSFKLLIAYRILMRLTSVTIKNSQALIMIYNTQDIDKRMGRFGGVYKRCAKLTEIECISGAVHNILLASYSIGLGATWLVMPTICGKTINRHLKINNELVAVVSLGYPLGKGKRSFRKSLNEILEIRK